MAASMSTSESPSTSLSTFSDISPRSSPLTTPSTSPSEPNLPGIRACIFDLDGLLIDSEDIVTRCVNETLAKYGRPALTPEIRVQLMGVADSTNKDVFHNWAKLPCSREEFNQELRVVMNQHFTTCKPLPGAEKLLYHLSRAQQGFFGEKIQLALASSTHTEEYRFKSSRPETQRLLSYFAADRQILGDDPKMKDRRGKPAPDIYQLALASLQTDDYPIRPDECLVFEDSVYGVEAARRAGMRVVWVPHPILAAEWVSRQKEVLAGKTGTSKLGDEEQLGEIDDGFGECISSLEHFDYSKYDILLSVPTNKINDRPAVA